MEGLNEHFKDQVKLAGAKFGGAQDDSSGNVPVTGDVASLSDVKIERV